MPPSAPPPASVAPAVVAVEDATIAPVTAARLGASWRAGCPVPPARLRLVTVPYVDFQGVLRTGELIVHADVAHGVAKIFSRLAADRFPIRQIRTIEQFGADDDVSLAADNTAAFNCRRAVTAHGPGGWSEHAYGRAIDLNPIENPYLPGDGRVMPPAGAPYTDRSDVRPGMAGPGTVVNNAFGAQGWAWGGTWEANPDYQHFSISGR